MDFYYVSKGVLWRVTGSINSVWEPCEHPVCERRHTGLNLLSSALVLKFGTDFQSCTLIQYTDLIKTWHRHFYLLLAKYLGFFVKYWSFTCKWVETIRSERDCWRWESIERLLFNYRYVGRLFLSFCTLYLVCASLVFFLLNIWR